MCTFKVRSSTSGGGSDSSGDSEEEIDMENFSSGDEVDDSEDSSEDSSSSEPEAGVSNEQNQQENPKEESEGEEKEDALVKAITAAKERVKEHPPDIAFDDLIVDISFHPGENIIAAGSVVGDVFLYKYTNDGNELLNTLELHVKACRDIEFNNEGTLLYSCGKDKCVIITDTETGRLKSCYEDAHEQPLYSLYVYDDNVICTGDEEGTVKVWDIREKNSVMSFKHMDDFVSDMITTEAKKFLVCSSGDGTITSFNMPAKKMFIQSEDYDTEFNCMQLLKYEEKVLVCSSKGKMYLFNWGQFGYHSDVFPGPKHSINSVLAITEHVVVTGYDDGNIRAVNLFPHQQLGVVGQHQCSVESLDISHDGQFIASSSLDQSVKFWNIKYFEDLYVVKKKTNKRVDMSKNLPSSKVRNNADFFADLK